MSWRIEDTNQSIPERFEEQARRYRDKVAIAGTSWQPGFQELDAAANGLAHAVVERDGGGEGRVALLLRHDAPLIAAILGALKAGKTVLTLNPGDPPARLERMRASADIRCVLCDQRHQELALRAGFAPDRLILVPDRPDGEAGRSPALEIEPDRVAFLVQTSGSTGEPKGVMQSHRNMLHNVLRQTSALEVGPDDRVTLLASPSGAQGVAMMWVALLSGATLCPFPVAERGVTGLVPWLDEHGATLLNMSASLFRNFVRTVDGGQRLPNISVLRIGSEPSSRHDFDAFRRHLPPDCVMANMYASSEAGQIARCWLTTTADPAEGPLPVGLPAEGVEVRVVDESGEPAPSGRTGEIVVDSEYLSPGYWGDPALTAERFSETANGGRRFRTGDVGWLSDDGVLTVVGRSDSQVNVRGYLVELTEVEGAMARLPGVDAAAVGTRTAPGGDVRLAGYVTAQPRAEISTATLGRALREVLPDHAVPSSFAVLDSMPLSSHGKVDRRRLAEIEPAQPEEARSASPPTSGLEELLAAIWARAFEVKRVDRDDDFFELGGDSLTAAVIAAELHGELGVEVELGTFASGPTVASMARLVERLEADTEAGVRPALASASSVERPPASFYQEDIWRSSRTPEGSLANTVTIGYRIDGAIDVPALRRGVDDLVRRHEALRTTFEEHDGRLVQVVHRDMAIDLPLIDLSGSRDASAEADELIEQEARTPFDLERGPLIRLWLVRIREDEHRLVRVTHHIASDAFSWELFFSELGPIYAARSGGREPPRVDGPPLQYGAFAAWERRSQRPDSRRHRDEVEWWRPAFDPDLPALPLPCARPSIDTHAPASDGLIWWGLPPDVSARLARLAAESGGTYYMVRLALFAALLAAETGSEEVVVLTTMSKRQLPQLQEMFGPCLDFRPLRIHVTPEETVSRWVRRIRSVVIDASAHSEIPLRELSEQLGAGGVPGVQAMFAEQHPLERAGVGDLEITSLRYVFTSRPIGLSIWMNRRQEADGCYLRFDPRFFEPAAIRGFIARYQRLAAEAHAHADRPVAELLDRPADSLFERWRTRLAQLRRS